VPDAVFSTRDLDRGVVFYPEGAHGLVSTTKIMDHTGKKVVVRKVKVKV
jgi:hypothetical protein